MTFPIVNTTTLLLALFFAQAARAADDYTPGPDSTTQPSAPHGEVLKSDLDNSKLFPGTAREIWVYVPQQYSPEKPACVYVGQDGLRFNAPTVFDNLIAKKEMPITIGVFVMHGRVKALDDKTAIDRFNRSYEYDGLGDKYARFILEEVLPKVETMKTGDGRAINLSHEGNDRAIGGSSSGAICAFTAAWERPDAFTRVFSSIGTYVDLRGGGHYSSLIRKYEPKSIRVFLQDGSADNNKYGGDWWMANQMMERALTFAGYEVQHAWGDGGHTGKQANAIFPDAMRFLWKDWPQPVKKGVNANQMLQEILPADSGWVEVGAYGHVDGIATEPNGSVYFNDIKSGELFSVAGDNVTKVGTPKFGGLAVNEKGTLIGIDRASHRLADEAGEFLPGGFTTPNDLVVAHNGNIYVTDNPAKGSDAPSQIWLIDRDHKQTVVDTGLKIADGIAISPDESLLYVSDYHSHWVYSYQIQPDGTLTDKQQYYWLHAPDTADDAGGDGMCVDCDGRLYVATRLGVQVCDQAGRVNCILPTPNGKVSALALGGEKFDTLFATCGDKVFKRKLNVKGHPACAAPVKPAPPKL